MGVSTFHCNPLSTHCRESLTLASQGGPQLSWALARLLKMVCAGTLCRKRAPILSRKVKDTEGTTASGTPIRQSVQYLRRSTRAQSDPRLPPIRDQISPPLSRVCALHITPLCDELTMCLGPEMNSVVTHDRSTDIPTDPHPPYPSVGYTLQPKTLLSLGEPINLCCLQEY